MNDQSECSMQQTGTPEKGGSGVRHSNEYYSILSISIIEYDRKTEVILIQLPSVIV